MTLSSLSASATAESTISCELSDPATFEERALRGGNPPGSAHLKVLRTDFSRVGHDSLVSHAEIPRNGEVDPHRISVGEVVQRERRIVRDDAAPAAPQDPARISVLSLAGPSGKPKEAAINTEPVAMVCVVLLRLVAVADGDSLGGREVARLTEGQLVELTP